MKLNGKVAAAITILLLLHQYVPSIQAQEWRVDAYGCIAPGVPQVVITRANILVQTGEKVLDEAITEDIDNLDRLFGVQVPVYFWNEKWTRAQFFPYKFRPLMIADNSDPDMDITGSVFVSIGLIEDEFRQAKGRTIALPAILGHEFAHAMQKSNSFPYPGKWKELHADFMAGWYIAYRERLRLDVKDLMPLLKSFYRKGDESDNGFFQVDPHGNSVERIMAVAAGFGYGFAKDEATGLDAYRAGIKYVKFFGAN
ncbi:MAG TPA: hypothetical protein VJ464_19550 [Blastocatellia bacterium]|nr:hypothetical protein [Blastocatellia bacterium]